MVGVEEGRQMMRKVTLVIVIVGALGILGLTLAVVLMFVRMFQS